jgi:prepilin-type N-terminal cleavage/methylation domain-containing protein
MKPKHTHSGVRRQSGLSMVELLVALAIGSFLIIGAVTLQSQTRRSFDVGEQQARLQEAARFVIATIEPDLQLAGLYGYSQDPSTVLWYNAGALTSPSAMRTDMTRVAGLPASLATCGNNFAIDVLATVEATNGAFDLACAPEGGGAAVG